MLDTLDDADFTDWYKSKVKPIRSGAYSCLYRNGEGKLVKVFATWTGKYWSVVRTTPEALEADALGGRLGEARIQKIRWRGLTEQGLARVNALIEAERLEGVKKENLALLRTVRELEEKGRSLKERAKGNYLIFLRWCSENRRLAQRAKDCLGTSDLASLRPLLKLDIFKEYVETDGTPDEVNQRLRAAEAAAYEYVNFWTYLWCYEIGLMELIDPSSASDEHEVEGSSGRLTVDWDVLADRVAKGYVVDGSAESGKR